MPTEATSSADLVMRTISSAGWECYVLGVPDFPVREQDIAPARTFVAKLCKALQNSLKLVPEIFLQYTQLELGDAAARLSAHGREWMPNVGLGVWPDRAAPCMYQPDDFLSLGIGERPRRIMYQLFHVTADIETRYRALQVMLGTGAVTALLTSESRDLLISRGREVFLPNITDVSFISFDYYIPLLETGTIGVATKSQMDVWCCGASVYIRESPEDRGIVITSGIPLQPFLQALGGELRTAPERGWCFPYSHLKSGGAQAYPESF